MKQHTTFYISEKVKEMMDFLVKREGIPKTLFLKRAIKEFLAGEQKLDYRVLIKTRKDPEYIRRNILEAGYVEKDQLRELERIAAENNCKVAPVIFQAIVNYCAFLLSNNQEGITITKK